MKLSTRKNEDRKTSRRKKMIKWIVAGAAVVLIPAFCYYENHHLVVTEYTYASEDLPDSFQGYRIVQISDFHNATFGKDNRKLIRAVVEEGPHMVVITGDMIDRNRTDTGLAVEFAGKLYRELNLLDGSDETDRVPILYVTGNHEMWLEPDEREEFLEQLEAAGVHVLRGENYIVSRGDREIMVTGLDDQGLGHLNLCRLMEEEEEISFHVVLAHEAQYFEDYANNSEADLIFSGHLHGGQFRAPFDLLGDGLVAPDVGLFPKMTSGMHTQNDTTVVISRGLGNSVIPVRLFNDPEIVTVTLEGK